MRNKISFKNKVSVGLVALAGICFTTSIGCYRASAAINGLRSGIRRAGSITSSLSNGLRRSASVSSLRSTGGPLSALNQRLSNLESQRNTEMIKNRSWFNKAIMASGVISSASIVAGVIGGIVQQSKFIGLSNEQSKLDQKVQEDLSNKRYTLQEKEIPEAERYIIDYYKENYGVDITKK